VKYQKVYDNELESALMIFNKNVYLNGILNFSIGKLNIHLKQTLPIELVTFKIKV
jgi:hypothetical protein